MGRGAGRRRGAAARGPTRPRRRPGLRAGRARGTVGWRDRADAERPGTRNRIGIVRRGRAPGPRVPQRRRGASAGDAWHAAGRELRERFSGPDGEVGAQTGHRPVPLDPDPLRTARPPPGELAVAARLPLLTELTAPYRVPTAVIRWFTPPITPGRVDPAWADAAAALTHLRALTAEGVLDWDTDSGTPPPDPDAPA